MNGQVKSPRERLTGLGTSTTNWFASLIPPEQIAGMPDILHVTEETHQHQLHETVLATEVDNKVKTKLLTMWNNVKYESPVWLLGSCYYKKPEEALSLDKASEAGLDPDSSEDESLAEDATIMNEGMDGFKRDFVSRLWLTYRKEFPILNGSTYTTDCGWGCMLRSGQMMLAQALVCHFLGRDWRWRPDQKDEMCLQDEATHRMIIKWFGDQPTEQTPLSIHTLVKFGASAGKRAGDWYGPASVAHLLILLVPLRLGADKLNPNYAPCLTALLQLDVCIGVIGGRPKHSLYFIGYQEDKLIHLDPHYCQEAVDVWKDNFPLASFHCSSPRKMLLSKMDPSCCVGFYFSDKQAFDKFVLTIERSLVPSNQKVDYPMFLFCEGSGDEIRRGYEVTEDMMATANVSPDQFPADELPYECEEFEVL
ncbi:hypothetical protein G9C98_007910 [Cotesia typhae]|uniref:Cysteine protease n=1 Tax=Cotesia typhae TaxID=2053667 RepID=A0A8J5V5W7_9HYME|nr:hypothetical protein G9C98_007910 [Cotesia typhae]